VAEVSTIDEIDVLVDQFYAVVTGFFVSAANRHAKKFLRLAHEQQNTTKFAVSYDSAFAEEEGVSQPGLVVYQRFDSGKAVMDPFDATKVEAFITEERYPVFDSMSIVNYHGYLYRGYPLVYLFVEDYYKPDPVETALMDHMRSLALEYKGRLSVTSLDASGFSHFFGEMSMEAKWPSLAITEANRAAYRHDQDVPLTKEGITQFVLDYFAGKLTPLDTDSEQGKAERAEKKAKEGKSAVVKLTAENFKAIAFDKKSDSFIKFFAPWCGHCKKMAGAWERLAKDFISNDKIVIAEYDGSADDASKHVPKKVRREGLPHAVFREQAQPGHKVHEGARLHYHEGLPR